MTKWLWIGLTGLLLGACGVTPDEPEAGALDAGAMDSGAFDAGPLDAGPGPRDGGRLDAGDRVDGGPTDSGSPAGCSGVCGDPGACEAGAACVAGACVTGVVVDSDSTLLAAIRAGTEAVILVRPGTYGLSDMATGLDRTALPLTIQGLDPCERPVFLNATQSLRGTSHVAFRDLSFVNDGGLDGGIWFHDPGGNGDAGVTHHITIERCDFTSPDPGDKTSATPDPDYGASMVSLFRFSNYATHTYTLRDITASYARQIGDFRMNGEVILDGIAVDFWYFDGIRIIASGDEGYMDGDRLIANVDLTNNLAVYEEIDGASTPHPDNTQVFNTGSTANNTNPRVQNLMFYRNRFNPGQYRSSNTQAGLTQSPMINVAYVENLWATLASPHGVSLEGGANGVLIERNTIGDVNWSSRPWVRIFRADGQVVVADSFFPSGFNTRTDGNANRAGYELEATGNDTSSSYASLFGGPPSVNGIGALTTMFTPLAGVTVGALDATGGWRGGPHRPMRAAAPTVSGMAGALRVDTIREPTLQSPNQRASGGDTYVRRDLRWSVSGTHAWSVALGVAASDVVPAVPAGSIDVQTRCVNSAGEGLWSATATVTVE